jgi:xanthine dehydrogenase accessory factor
MIKAVVGSGGKTTLIHQLAKQYRKAGKKVFVTTTTKMLIEEDTLLLHKLFTSDHLDSLADF